MDNKKNLLEIRKIIIENVLSRIEKIISTYDDNHLKPDTISNEDVNGLCSLISMFLNDIKYGTKRYNDIYLMSSETINIKTNELLSNYKTIILNDIQNVNDIYLRPYEYYSEFCEKLASDINTIDDLKLWYEKRILALEKTIEYYNKELKKCL
jgi:hypothetical protein